MKETQLSSHLAQSQKTNKGIRSLIFMHQEAVRTTLCRDEITQGYYVDNSSTNITTLKFWGILDFIKFAIVLSRHYLSYLLTSTSILSQMIQFVLATLGITCIPHIYQAHFIPLTL